MARKRWNRRTGPRYDKPLPTPKDRASKARGRVVRELERQAERRILREQAGEVWDDYSK